MPEIIFNASGVPLLGFGSRHFFQTVGAPASSASGDASASKRGKILLPSDPDPDSTSVESFEVADWGTGNRFPETSDALISKIGVLNTGLKFIRNFTLGQGIYPVRVDRHCPAGAFVPSQGL